MTIQINAKDNGKVVFIDVEVAGVHLYDIKYFKKSANFTTPRQIDWKTGKAKDKFGAFVLSSELREGSRAELVAKSMV